MVEGLFQNLPVRRQEFLRYHVSSLRVFLLFVDYRNIRKQYQQLLNLLQAYAVVATGTRINVVNVLKV